MTGITIENSFDGVRLTRRREERERGQQHKLELGRQKKREEEEEGISERREGSRKIKHSSAQAISIRAAAHRKS